MIRRTKCGFNLVWEMKGVRVFFLFLVLGYLQANPSLILTAATRPVLNLKTCGVDKYLICYVASSAKETNNQTLSIRSGAKRVLRKMWGDFVNNDLLDKIDHKNFMEYPFL